MSSADCPGNQSCYGDPIFCADEFMNDCADYWASDKTVIFYPSADSGGTCLPPAHDKCDEFNACEDGICVTDLLSGTSNCETDNICTDDANCDPGYECYSSLEYCDAAYADCSTQQVADSGYSIIYYQEGGGRCRKANAIGVNCDNEDNACLSGKCSVDGFCVDVVKPMPLELIVIMRTTLVLVESVQLMDFVMMSMLIVPLFTPLIRLVLSTLLLVRMVVVEKSNHLVLIVMIQQMLVTALGVVPTNILVLSIVILQTDTCVMLARRARK